MEVIAMCLEVAMIQPLSQKLAMSTRCRDTSVHARIGPDGV